MLYHVHLNSVQKFYFQILRTLNKQKETDKINAKT